MLAGGYSWRLYFYVEIAFAGALLILAFFVVEETMYDRKKMMVSMAPSLEENNSASDAKEVAQHHENPTTFVPERKSFISTLKPWSKIDHEAEFFMTMIRPFSYFVVPAVFWVITTYGLPPPSHETHSLTLPRNLHRPRSFSIQLHIPNQNRCPSLQLERRKLGPHRGSERIRLPRRRAPDLHL